MTRSFAATLCVLMNAMALLWLMMTAPAAPVLAPAPVVYVTPAPVVASNDATLTLCDDDIRDLRADGSITFEGPDGSKVVLMFVGDDWQTY